MVDWNWEDEVEMEDPIPPPPPPPIPSPPPRDLTLDLQMMNEYKALDCPAFFHHVLPHHPEPCPYIHPGQTRRRNLKDFYYYPELCPSLPNCHKEDRCRFAHNIYEHCLHPIMFRSTRCCYGLSCRRNPCLFPHNPGPVFWATSKYGYESPPRYRSASPRAKKPLPPYPLLPEMPRMKPIPFEQ